MSSDQPRAIPSVVFTPRSVRTQHHPTVATNRGGQRDHRQVQPSSAEPPTAPRRRARDAEALPTHDAPPSCRSDRQVVSASIRRDFGYAAPPTRPPCAAARAVPSPGNRVGLAPPTVGCARPAGAKSSSRAASSSNRVRWSFDCACSPTAPDRPGSRRAGHRRPGTAPCRRVTGGKHRVADLSGGPGRGQRHGGR